MSIINKEFVKEYITTNGSKPKNFDLDVPFKWAHGSTIHHLGGGLIYYTIVYYMKAKMCVCLGSGGGFVPRIITQARRDLVYEGVYDEDNGVTIIVDSQITKEIDWQKEDSFFRKHFNPLWLKKSTEEAYYDYFVKKDIEIDYLHIDAGHSYEDVSRDFDLYSSSVKRGGIITLHDTDIDYRDKDIYDAPDYWSIEGPNKKMNEIKENKNYELINFFNNPYNEIPSSTGTTIIRKV